MKQLQLSADEMFIKLYLYGIEEGMADKLAFEYSRFLLIDNIDPDSGFQVQVSDEDTIYYVTAEDAAHWLETMAP